ncbi:hypothetical protein TVAGG3_0176820 [Trichomonas vaginalis G3]|nr:hypothetical protein TVAGG3_0176820 [Trichomonas vaginalis G3]KAI5549004.1 hypothetical protein TVAGG3_0176820 [Trichomonas vaginalis G3]
MNGINKKEVKPQVELPPNEIEDPEKLEQEKREKEKQAEEASEIANKSINKLIDKAFEGIEPEASESVLVRPLFQLGIIGSMNRKFQEVEFLKDVLPEWSVNQQQEEEGKPCKYQTEKVVSSLKEAYVSKGGSEFYSQAKIRLTVILANGKLIQIPDTKKKEEKRIKRDKFLVKLPPQQPYRGMSEETKKWIAKADRKPLEDRVKDELKDLDSKIQESREKEEQEKREKKKKLDNEAISKLQEKEQQKSIQYQTKMQAYRQSKSKLDKPKPISYEEYLQIKEKQKHAKLPGGYQERINAMHKIIESKQKKPEPRTSYKEFLEKKDVLFKDVNKPNGWDQKINQMRLGYELAKKKREEAEKAKEIFPSSPKSSRKSVSSFSSVSTLKENSNTHNLDIDEDSIQEPV